MKSIRRQLTAGVAAVCALLLAASGTLAWLVVRESLLRQFDASLRARAAFIQANIEEEDGELELDLELEPSAPAAHGSAPVFFQAWSADGASRLKSESLGFLQLPLLEAPARASSAAPPGAVNLTLPDGTPIRAVVARFDAKGDKHGLFQNSILVTARSTQSIQSTLRLLLWVLAGTGAVALTFVAPLIRWVLHRGLRPLDELARRTAEIDAEDLATRLPEEGNPQELRPVVNRLNGLLARLEASFARERRFSSDVAHELRTPVAELKALAELALSWPDQATPESFGQVRDIAREMQEVIERLTLLARAEAGTQAVSAETVALDALVEDIAARLAAEAQHRQIHLELNVQPVSRQTDASLLKMLISNLMGNAVRHSPAKTTVQVRLDQASLVVRNPAPDLSPEDVPQMFERFWRKDEARAGYGHSGLGLPLARTLAGLLQCSIEPALADGVLEMRVRLMPPLSSAKHDSTKQDVV